jgi:hypothetical protein
MGLHFSGEELCGGFCGYRVKAANWLIKKDLTPSESAQIGSDL